MSWETQGHDISTPGMLRRAFPVQIQVVPVLGPIEHEETIISEDTVKRSLNTHRASRHFRNYWRYFPDGFESFASLVSKTWPGMELDPPELPDQLEQKLIMFCRENRIAREIFWAGFGFQVWCQLLTHVSRASDATILIVDEPEIYLHPDIQRQLLGILRDIPPDILLASHSTEIMSEADPGEILLVDKAKRSAERLKNVEGIQKALESVGSVQNITRYSRFKSYWSNETKFDDRFTIKPAIRAIDFEFPGKKPRTTTISARFLRFSDALVPSPSGSILKRKNAL